MQLIGEDPRKHIQDFSNQFLRDFIQQLRTSHGEKKTHINHFYQEYIANKEHIHMNSTKWPSLTEFAKHLGREGICRVEETEKGLHISWIDNSPEALRRQDAIRKKERQDKGDEEREQRLIREQVEKARLQAKADEEANSETKTLKRAEGETIKLSFGAKPASSKPATPPQKEHIPDGSSEGIGEADGPESQVQTITPPPDEKAGSVSAPITTPASSNKVTLGFGAAKPKNVFASKKNPLAGRGAVVKEAPKKMSEAERIMKEELERKRMRDGRGSSDSSSKRQKV